MVSGRLNCHKAFSKGVIQLKGLSDKKPMGFGWGGVWGMGYGVWELVGCKMLWDKRGYGFSEGIREVMGSQRYKDTGICVYELVQNSQKRQHDKKPASAVTTPLTASEPVPSLPWTHAHFIPFLACFLALFWHSFGQAKDIPVL
ncbi:uncharacterized protein LACBIDRAFT_335571 [Laccaria bicolor S238N-H82]|uniref:Predicted protein n=1 Tax=Laccaria bicolor (strain S238N-H82 / ATCC MYA-4686) TaxID=486041 RepID=B0E2P5_LACBS|nr:uncharacterized protein LACBIDRAFT_335571 [Laccaria bicolor S238N-H82]EDQ98889.1 predicted protein [Laccaria bicolor S238N-H82]|eukprot:XP_001890468.1 predicted protein [Laccaria bicolor S238N-H82]